MPQLVPFSRKQIIALTWWLKNSDYQYYDAIICDGAIRSGKTLCMAMSFIFWSFYRFNNSYFALCGKTIRSLKRNVVVPIIPILTDLGFLCKYKVSENFLNITHDGIVNTFYLFGGKDEASSSLIQGLTLSGILCDEVALMPKSFVEQALARCSVNGSKFWFNCNPENPQHWFYKEWIINAKKRNAFYLHFDMTDNPSLSKSVIDRYKRLYTGSFYQRFIEGKWVSTEGIIYPYMTKDTAFCDVPKKCFSKYAVSCDYGVVNPTSCGLWAEYDGVWYRINEYYYDSRREGESRTDEEHYNELLNLIGNRKIDYIIVDPSASSFITLIRKRGDFLNVIPAKNNVVDGIREVSTALKSGKIKICNVCADSIREFSLYRWAKGEVKDLPVKENDHAMDDIRYFVTTILSAADDDAFFALAAER